MAPHSKPRQTMGKAEFIALMAMMVATVAFSIDAMLPALSSIADELTPNDRNRAQLILTSFLIGMGTGTFFTGPLSDSFGRKTLIFWGASLYLLGAVLAWAAPTLELVIAARIIQGIGAASARVVPIAIIRDLYSGREMARIASIMMMVFTLVPAISPMIGTGVIYLAGWRGISAAFILFSLISVTWMSLRLVEPLPRAKRLPFRPGAIRRAIREVLAHPVVRMSTLVQTLCMTALFSSINSIQQVFDITYDRGETFPVWFCFIALGAGIGSYYNASVVVRLGMRRLVKAALLTLVCGTSLILIIQLSFGHVPFWLYFLWQASVFGNTAMTLGNLNAIALEPMGHIAGTATSVFSALATVGSALLAMPVGQFFNGTPLPLFIGVLLALAFAYLLMCRMPETE